MKTVLCFGTFDGLHPGHLSYLRQAKKQGDKLVVIVARDETVKQVKGYLPELNQAKRTFAVQSIPMVDLTTVGYPGDKYKVIEEVKPDIICLGYDQQAFTEDLKEKLAQRGLKVKILRMKAFKPEIYKSSKIKERQQRK